MAIDRLYSKQIKTYDLKEKNTMTIGETIRKAIKEVSDGMLDLIGPKSFRLTDDEEIGLYVGLKREEKPKRARTKSGKYRGDDKSTKNYNEAYVGGKAPTRKELLSLKKMKKYYLIRINLLVIN